MAEKKPIIQLFLLRFQEAWFKLSEEKKEELHDRAVKNLEKIGANITVYDSRWSDAWWREFGVIEYPDIEAVQKQFKFMEEIAFFRYTKVKSYLGTPRR